MTNIASVSRSQLTQRRRTLRRVRRLKMFQALWQTLAVSGLLGGLIWATTRPIWVLSASNQIAIEGNQLISDQKIQSLIPLSYPQSLLLLQPEAVARSLKSHPPIADATVTRHLVPPGIIIQIKERVPVAIAQTLLPKSSASLTPKLSVGLLDEKGVWMPIQSYTSLASSPKLPSLKVLGLPQQYRPYWPQLYQTVSHSPIKVTEIDCQDPGNLILKTDLGIVHFGAYSSRFAYQLNVLDKMRQLPAQLNLSQIAYIDIKNPDAPPSVHMNQSVEPVKSDTP